MCRPRYEHLIRTLRTVIGYSTRSPSDSSESISIWGIAKQLSVTFSSEDEEILKELENMEKRDMIQRKGRAGENIGVNENH